MTRKNLEALTGMPDRENRRMIRAQRRRMGRGWAMETQRKGAWLWSGAGLHRSEVLI
nr:MAG TPA: hypothetical protein [Caudoviricetes sp.]